MPHTKEKAPVLTYILATNMAHQGIAQKVRGQCQAFSRHFTTHLQIYDYHPQDAPHKKIMAYIRFHLQAIQALNCSDLIYYRYNTKFPILHLAMALRALTTPIFFEHNTDYTPHLRYLKRYTEAWLNQLTINLLRYTRINHVSVTDHIRDALNLPSRYHLYIQNGYADSLIPEPLSPALQTLCNHIPPNTPIGIFVGDDYGWNGIQDLIEKIKIHPTLHVIIVGKHSHMEPHPRIHHTGQLSPSILKTLYTHCTFGIGSLRYDKIKLTKGASLKIREYLCNGLSVWLHHDDAVMDSPQLHPYIYPQHQNQNALNDLLATPQDRIQIAETARQALSWDTVMTPLIQAMNESLS